MRGLPLRPRSPRGPASAGGASSSVRLRASEEGFEAQPNRRGPCGPRGATVRLRLESLLAREDRPAAPREEALGELGGVADEVGGKRPAFDHLRSPGTRTDSRGVLGRYPRSRERLFSLVRLRVR